MSTLREAAQQALEALEFMADEWGFTQKANRLERWQAIEALRAALAQQDEPKGGGKLPPPLQAEPVEEPVAWRSPNASPPGGFVIFQQYPQALADLGGVIEPLYTAPPQRLPLTKEDVAQNLRSRYDAANLLEERRQELSQELAAARTPPRREWEGLRNKEIVQIVTDNLTGGDWVDVARAIEAALKEKNA